MIRIGQIKTLGSNSPNSSLLPFLSQDSYPCANAQITKGFTAPPPTLQNCFNRFPNIKSVADAIGFSFGTMWLGPGTGGAEPPKNTVQPMDVLLENPSDECVEVMNSSDFGKDWLGCLWGSPEASFSCICPDYGPKFEAYMKLRQNVATFWNTRKDTPVKRQEFLDSLQFGPKVEITVPGDFDFKLGSVVYLNASGVSKNPTKEAPSKLNDKYWIVGIKHVVTNSGTHESRLLLTRFATDSAY